MNSYGVEFQQQLFDRPNMIIKILMRCMRINDLASHLSPFEIKGEQ